MRKKLKIELLEDAKLFLHSLDEKERRKIIYNLDKASYLKVPTLFKKLKGNIWEFRTLYKGNSYRMFAFWDKRAKENTLVIATHGIVKKTNKTPAKEIEKAEQIRKRYFGNC